MDSRQPLLITTTLLLIVIFTGCSRPEKEKELIRFMSETLEQSGMVNKMSTSLALKSLEEKTKEACTRENALKWYPKAQQVAAVTKKALEQVYEMRKQHKTGNATAGSLVPGLIQYRKAIEAIDSAFINRMQLDLSFIPRFLRNITGDSTGIVQQLQQTDQVLLNGYLTILEAELKIAENRLVYFCIQMSGGCCLLLMDYSILVSQSSTVLQPGENLTITAGVGAFSKQAHPMIRINNIQTPVKETGYSVYHLKAPQKPGKYSVPVIISFTNPETLESKTKQQRIYYEVAEKCN